MKMENKQLKNYLIQTFGNYKSYNRNKVLECRGEHMLYIALTNIFSKIDSKEEVNNLFMKYCNNKQLGLYFNNIMNVNNNYTGYSNIILHSLSVVYWKYGMYGVNEIVKDLIEFKDSKEQKQPIEEIKEQVEETEITKEYKFNMFGIKF